MQAATTVPWRGNSGRVHYRRNTLLSRHLERHRAHERGYMCANAFTEADYSRPWPRLPTTAGVITVLCRDGHRNGEDLHGVLEAVLHEALVPAV